MSVQEHVTEALATYSETDASIAELKVACLALVVDGVEDKEGFEAVHTARMDVRARRVAVDKTRKSLKADALQFNRSVEAEAKRITALLLPIEAHLEKEERVVLEERARLKQEKALAKQEKLRGRMELLAEVASPLHSFEVESMSGKAFDACLENRRELFEEEKRVKAERAAADAAKRKEEEAAKAKEAKELAARRKAIEKDEKALAKRKTAWKAKQEKEKAAAREKRDAEKLVVAEPEPELDTCGGCGKAVHASESDDYGRCPDCTVMGAEVAEGKAEEFPTDLDMLLEWGCKRFVSPPEGMLPPDGEFRMTLGEILLRARLDWQAACEKEQGL